jgi:hypothetical protein
MRFQHLAFLLPARRQRFAAGFLLPRFGKQAYPIE